MRARMFSILFVVSVTLCLTAGMALGNDTNVFEPLNHRSALAAPTLTVTTSGTMVSLSWTSVAGATGYTLSYAPSPYTGPASIGSIPMGTQTAMSAILWEGAAYYVAIQAYDSVESSGYSNIEYFIISGGTPSTYTNSLDMTFILIPSGTFTMGSPPDEPGRSSWEGPQHQVTLTQPFYMQQTEVTQAQWEAVMGRNPSYFSGCLTCPVEWVSWNDVGVFIEHMNARREGTYSLPTEAQWEYAVRAGSTTAFYNGEITSNSNMYGCNYDGNLTAIGWYCDNSNDQTHPVAQKTPNGWGLYDMSGNVYEWCHDWLGAYPSGAVTDPKGPSSGSYRIVRGGDWFVNATTCRSADRFRVSPGFRGSSLGFRLIREP